MKTDSAGMESTENDEHLSNEDSEQINGVHPKQREAFVKLLANFIR